MPTPAASRALVPGNRCRSAPELWRHGRAHAPAGSRAARRCRSRPAIASWRRSKNRPKQSRCISPACNWARRSCRSTPRIHFAELEYFLGDAAPTVAVVRPADRQQVQSIAQRCGVKHVETLDERGGGSLLTAVQARDDRAPNFITARCIRAGGAALHLGHHRPLQGRDAVASQPRFERHDAGASLAVHCGRRVAARTADLSRARTVCRDQYRARRGQLHAVPA